MNDTPQTTAEAMPIALDVLARVKSHLKYWTKEPPSVAGLRVAALLDFWQGLHHMDPAQMKRVEWSNPRFQVVKLSKYTCPGGGLATWDFHELTTLVFLAHDFCIRVDITPCNAEHLALSFHPRAGREGGMSSRHPTIETALASWRQTHPLAEGGAA